MTNHTKYRILEIIPGVMVWSTFVLAIILAFVKPLWGIYFIIVFDCYWLVRICYLLIYLLNSCFKYRRAVKINWLEKVKKITGWEKVYHLIILPTYKEPVNVLRTTFGSLAAVNYPLDKLIVVLAGEERDQVNFLNIAEILEKEFGHIFFKFLVTLHPKDIEDELAGKGANATWAAKQATKLIDELQIPYEDILVSNFDADTCPHPEYFSYLTYTFLLHPNRTRASYQPVAVYNNNIWDSPAILRIINNSTTFWLFTDLARPERLFTFSSHSMSFKALVEIGYWQTDIVTEDSRICLQGMVRYNGDYEVVPIHIPVSMDTPYAGKFWESLVNQYRQIRRWAYGVENFPYIVWQMWGNKKISFRKKFRYLWNQLEGTYSWATAPILIFFMGYLPLYTAGKEVKATVFTQNAPIVLRYLMTISMVGLFFSAVLSLIMLPPKPKKQHGHKYYLMVLQWLLFPYCMILFGSIPAIDAQTRLMLGKYLGFYVTKKAR
ncbi:MAG: glycosyltransferase family 2 protein [bacterium]